MKETYYLTISLIINLLPLEWKLSLLRNSPDKNDSNNGNEHVGMQKSANVSIVCTYFWLA